MLCDIHSCHYLDTGDDRGLHRGRNRKNRMQNSINSHPHKHLIFLRFQMDIAGLFHRRPLQNGINQTDGWRCLLLILIQLQDIAFLSRCWIAAFHVFDGTFYTFRAI